MSIDRAYYDKQYFCTPRYGRKRYRGSDGKIKVCRDFSDRAQWAEWSKILLKLRELLGFESLLDAGCACGSLVQQALRLDMRAIGIDFSDAAIFDLALYDARNSIFQADISHLPFKSDSFDLILSSSVLEHLYRAEIPRALSEFERVTRRWVFLNIAISAAPKNAYFLTPGEALPAEFEEIAAKGHVTMQTEDWWRELITRFLLIRNDLTLDFLLSIQSFGKGDLQLICEKKKRD